MLERVQTAPDFNEPKGEWKDTLRSQEEFAEAMIGSIGYELWLESARLSATLEADEAWKESDKHMERLRKVRSSIRLALYRARLVTHDTEKDEKTGVWAECVSIDPFEPMGEAMRLWTQS